MPTPVFIRAIASDGLGPVHSGVLHSMYMHFPGFRICAPMTPGEYHEIWNDFMEHDDPMFVSEHRESYDNREELTDEYHDDADITLYGISSTRFHLKAAAEQLAAEGIKCNIVHIVWLKPFTILERYLKPLNSSKLGLVIDASFEICGAARSIAYDLTDQTGHPVKALALKDQTKCLNEPLQNLAPGSQEIYDKVKQLLKST